MIIVRYLSKQILLVTAAITFGLLMVAVLGRLLKYLAQASQGELDPNVLLLLISYRIPEFLQLILPVALLLGILLAYGRMYAENEMTVLVACGLSRRRLLGLTLVASAVVACLVAGLALKVSPWGLVHSASLLEAQKNLNEFDVMVPGIFQNISRGARTTYAENIVDEEMQNVFMYEGNNHRVTVAKTALLSENDEIGRFIKFGQGSLTEGGPDEIGYTLTQFSELGVSIPKREISFNVAVEERGMATRELFKSSEPAHMAELQWRVSLVLIIPILTLLAVPLSKVSPRQGRFARLAPAILMYIFYFGLLMASRDMLKEGTLSPLLGLWWVHVLFVGLGLMLFFEKSPTLPLLKLFKKKVENKSYIKGL